METPAGFTEYFTRLNAGYASGGRTRTAGGEGTSLAGDAPESIRLPVILAAYSDVAPSVQSSEFANRLFGSHETGTMAGYYSEVSRGKFSLDGDILGWYTLPQPLSYYAGAGPLGDESLFPASPGGLVAQAVAAADANVDFGLYDNDGPDGVPNSGDDDGVVDALFVVHSGGDAAAGDADNLWSHTGRLGADSVVTGDPAAGGGSIRVKRYSLLPELAGNGSSPLASEIGVYCHEFGHQLGLVDLYPAGYNSGDQISSSGIGLWGLMGFGTQGGNGRSPERPTHPCAWSKLRLGWVETVHQDSSGPIELEPVQSSGRVVMVWDNDERGHSYFLLSNRARTGFDSTIPGSGLLVWHIDDRAFDNDSAAHKLVDLEEADGLFQLDSGDSDGDSGDPFPGSTGKTAFGPQSVPSSRRYDSSPSGVSLAGIRLEGTSAKFNLTQPVRTRITLSYDEHGPDPDRGYGYDNNTAHGAVVFEALVSGIVEAVSTVFLYPSMSYELTLYGGHDNGLLLCPAIAQDGETDNTGWKTIALDPPVYLEAGDSLVIGMAWQSSEFDHGWPVPYDRTGAPDGRSWVSLYGLGHYAAFDYDISLRAVMRPTDEPAEALVLGRSLEFVSPAVDLGAAFSGETYRFNLPLANTGSRPVVVKDPQVGGQGFSLVHSPELLVCGTAEPLEIEFAAPDEAGDYYGQAIVVAPGDSSAVAAMLAASVKGWSISYDTAYAPSALGVFTDAAHGAMQFRTERKSLLSGVRTLCLQDSMALRLRIWAAARDGGGKCLVAEMSSDTLIAGSGWHQLFLPSPVLIDSGDTFIADVRYSTPGVPYNELVPMDTTVTSPTASFYNLREEEGWIGAGHPVSVHALMMPHSGYQGEYIVKRPVPELRGGELVLAGIRVGEPSDSGIWLVNSGTSDMSARVSVAGESDSCLFAPDDLVYQVKCLDSVLVSLSFTALKPGVHTGLLEVHAGDSLLTAQLTVAADSYELSHDENGYTAAAGFNDSTAVAAAMFFAGWYGEVASALVHTHRAGSTVRAVLWGGLDSTGHLTDSLAVSPDTLLASSGWHELPLSPPLAVAAGDSFILAARIRATGSYPLSIDHRGKPSGYSYAGSSFEEELEKLNYDVNIRALVSAGGASVYAVAGRVTVAAGGAAAGARVMLEGEGITYRAVTDAEGTFLLSAVAAGAYNLSASLEGYVIQGQTDLLVDGELSGVELVARQAGTGDLDGNGRVDIFDLLRLLGVIGGNNQGSGGEDVDGSGKVDIFDVLELLSLLRQSG